MPATATPKVQYDRVECTRCCGTGRFASSAYKGICLGCDGLGKMLTPAGRAAKAAFDAWTEEHLTIEATELAEGQQFVDVDGKRRTANKVTVSEGRIFIATPAGVLPLSGTTTVRRMPTVEEFAARRAHVLTFKGAKLV